jgi:nicotinate-nucleotide adenylyltransferase
LRLGILGGTFDPIHIGHIAAARAAMDCAHLDRILFIPSAQPPHRAAAAASVEDRLAMARLAVEGETDFEVSDVEVNRGGKSYTVDTLAALHASHPGDELFLILGWDAARLFRSWRQPDQLSKFASVVIVTRPGTDAPKASELVATGIPPGRVIKCMVPTPDVSSSDLRRALAAGEPVAGKLPPAVERYIASRGLYRDNRDIGT